MKKEINLIIAALISIHTNVSCSTVENPGDSLGVKIDTLLARYNNKNGPGLTVGIIDNGRLVFEKGYGLANVENRLLNGPSVVYKVASVSKQFTAAAILKLIRDGKLSLNDNVYKYIPELPDYGYPISISDLLYHTSGIRDYMVLMWLCGISFEENFTNNDALSLIIRQKELNFVPRRRCVYSNSNYILLAETVKRITGQSLAQYAQNSLFGPIGIHQTGFDDRPVIDNQARALSYRVADGKYIAFSNNNYTIGDGGLSTTLKDLVKWDATFYDSSALSRQLATPGQLDGGTPLHYGMGIMTGRYRGDSVQMHPGAFLGYRAELMRFPEKKVSIVCLGNVEEINPEAITRQIADIYLYHQTDIRAEELRPDYDIELMRSITGKYETDAGIFIDVKYENGLLKGQAAGQVKQVLRPLSPNIYGIGDTDDSVQFESNDKGVTDQLIIRQKRGNTVAKKLALVSGNKDEYAGRYHSKEQNATYSFFIENGILMFKVGSNPKEKCEILEKYDKAEFEYKNLERATISFFRNNVGKVTGFNLSSGRVTGITFMKQ